MPARAVLGLMAGLLTAGCATDRTPTYRIVDISQQELSHAQAQRATTELYLRRQLRDPIDKPLRLMAVAYPAYPAYLQRAEIEGDVQARFIIGEDGSPGDVQIVGPPNDHFDPLVRQALARWRFEPITRAGRPVILRLNYLFQFRLK